MAPTGGPSAEPTLDDRQRLQRLVDGYLGTALVYVAAKLGLADLLADGPRASDDLARATQCHADALRRLLRGLVALGVLAETEDGRFALSPVGAWLRHEHPLSLRPLAVLTGEEFLAAWGDLLHSARTGETAFPHVFGMTVWEHRARHPELNAQFNRWMGQLTQLANSEQALVAAYDFSALRTICDVAGGQGALLAALLAASPASCGWLFEQPHVLAEAPALLDAAGVAARCALVAGDIFAAYPDELHGLAAYVLKNIIHDWDDAHSRVLLQRCRQAMGPRSRLLLVERLLPGRVLDDPATIWMDLRMLAGAGGRQRTEAEYRALCAAAGLALTRVLPTPSGFSIIEALPVAPAPAPPS
jgi:hypothetical protein